MRVPGFSVIFVHGRGGDQRLGMNDYTFGGNFNRIKNLMVLNGGAYLSPTVPSFDDAGASDIKALILAGRAPVLLACASMGSIICSKLANDPAVVPRLAGMAILGGAPDMTLAKSLAVRSKLPLVFTHGSDDSGLCTGRTRSPCSMRSGAVPAATRRSSSCSTPVRTAHPSG
jgi:pimeloyl-ACP methyl ester carboxylesterase